MPTWNSADYTFEPYALRATRRVNTGLANATQDGLKAAHKLGENKVGELIPAQEGRCMEELKKDGEGNVPADDTTSSCTTSVVHAATECSGPFHGEVKKKKKCGRTKRSSIPCQVSRDAYCTRSCLSVSYDVR